MFTNLLTVVQDGLIDHRLLLTMTVDRGQLVSLKGSSDKNRKCFATSVNRLPPDRFEPIVSYIWLPSSSS